jgi:hypothetical protein
MECQKTIISLKFRRLASTSALPKALRWPGMCSRQSRSPGHGDIAGTYVGVDAMAAALVGIGGNVLLGGSNNSIALQPISVQAETGVVIAAGLERTDLQSGR